MRRYDDPHGRTWDVVIGRESWGMHLALFVPAAGHEGPVRQTPLRASSQEQAAAELDAMDDAALADLLERSTIKD